MIAQAGFTLKAPEGGSVFFWLVPVTDPAVGNWEATVEWTFATNTMYVYVANGACTVQQFQSVDCPNGAACPCTFTIRSETMVPKPRVLTIPNAPGGTRTLIMMNLGPREEAGNYTVRLTSTSSSSATGLRAVTSTEAVSRVLTSWKQISLR